MTITYAKLLNPEEYDIKICLLSIANNKGIEQFIPPELKYEYLRFTSFGLNPRIIKEMYNVLRRESPDYVFSSLISINFRLLLLAPLFRHAKFIIRNNIYLNSSSLAQKILMCLTYPKAMIVIAQTEEMKDELIDVLKLDSNKVEVIQNPVDTQTIEVKLKDYRPFMNEAKRNYVAVGRFAPSKAFDVLVPAFGEVCRHEPESELYIVGRYDDNDDYFRSVRQNIISL